MPATPQTASLHRNCTRIIERVQATGLAVCRAGPVVALHVATLTGEVIITVAEAVFVAAARGPRDHNGNPWREFAEINTAGDRPFAPILLADAAAVPVGRIIRQNSHPEALKHAAIELKKSGGSPLSYGALCAQAGCNYHGFVSWRRRNGFFRPRLPEICRPAPRPRTPDPILP